MQFMGIIKKLVESYDIDISDKNIRLANRYTLPSANGTWLTFKIREYEL